MDDVRRRAAGLVALGASGLYLVGWWWLEPPDAAIGAVGAIWVALLLAGVALRYPGREG